MLSLHSAMWWPLLSLQPHPNQLQVATTTLTSDFYKYYVFSNMSWYSHMWCYLSVSFAMRYFLHLEWYIMPWNMDVCVCVCVFASPTARRYFVESSTIWLKLRPDYVWPRLFRPFLPTGSWLFAFLRDRFYFQPCYNTLQRRLYMSIHAHSWVIMYNVSNYGV